MQQKEKKRRKRKGEKKIPKIKKPKFDFCAYLNENVAKHDASGKKTKLSSCKCIFDQIKVVL